MRSFLTRSLVVAALATCALTIPAQADPPHPVAVQDYGVREQGAAVAIKQQLMAMRRHIATNKRGYQVGYTTALDHPITSLAGVKMRAVPLDQLRKQSDHATKLLQIDQTARADFAKLHPGVLQLDPYVVAEGAGTAWDWRRHGKVTPVTSQGGCGSCWAFASVAALESSYLVRTNTTVDASEQYVLSCSHHGSCHSGDWFGALGYLVSNGTTSETVDPYTATDAACPAASTTYKAVTWGPVDSSVYIPTVDTLKAAIKKYGPVVTGIVATDLFQGYTGGVFNEPFTGGPVAHDEHGNPTWLNANHAVTIVGWDDAKHAWLIKNSWGPGWGDTCGYGTERGYVWMDYGSSNVGIGSGWIVAQDPKYALPKVYYEILPTFVLHLPTPDPGPTHILLPPVQVAPIQPLPVQQPGVQHPPTQHPNTTH